MKTKAGASNQDVFSTTEIISNRHMLYENKIIKSTSMCTILWAILWYYFIENKVLKSTFIVLWSIPKNSLQRYPKSNILDETYHTKCLNMFFLSYFLFPT